MASPDKEKCPFCGNVGEAEFSLGKIDAPFGGHYWFVVCSCGAQGPHEVTPEKADEAWNRRTE